MDGYNHYGRNSRNSYDRSERSERGGRRGPDESTGAEAGYLRTLVDSRAEVTVVLQDGEQLRGRIRYFDNNLFSVQLTDLGLNILVRKDHVLCINEA